MKAGSDMKGRSLLKLEDFSDAEVLSLVDLAIDLKGRRKAGKSGTLLAGRSVVLIFEKMSTRTRCACVAAAGSEGGSAEFLGVKDIHLGVKESVADTARVLGRMFDGIMFRGYEQRTLVELSEFAGVPVWNGLTDDWHPTQALADIMTIREHFGDVKGRKLVYVGDGRNNVAKSLMFGCAQVGMDFVDCTPPALEPAGELVASAQAIAGRNGSSVQVSGDPVTAVRGADAVYTDVWTSMGEESSKSARIELLRPYQVDMNMMRGTGKLEDGGVIFLHCLPACHNDKTEETKDSGALEVTDDVFEAGFSKVFDQAENRVHTIKALMVATLG